jgi:hypothetical protein
MAGQQFPAQGTVVWAKFAPGFFTEDWQMLAAGTGYDAGSQRWYLVGTDRAWTPSAIERFVVLGDRNDTSWVHPDVAATLVRNTADR